jgi:hypothetical protein
MSVQTLQHSTTNGEIEERLTSKSTQGSELAIESDKPTPSLIGFR